MTSGGLEAEDQGEPLSDLCVLLRQLAKLRANRTEFLRDTYIGRPARKRGQPGMDRGYFGMDVGVAQLVSRNRASTTALPRICRRSPQIRRPTERRSRTAVNARTADTRQPGKL